MNDDNLSDTNPANCPHGVAMDIYCEKCDSGQLGQPYKIVGIEKALAPSVYEKEIWNAAIEAAAICIEAQFIVPAAIEVRKLKK